MAVRLKAKRCRTCPASQVVLLAFAVLVAATCAGALSSRVRFAPAGAHRQGGQGCRQAFALGFEALGIEVEPEALDIEVPDTVVGVASELEAHFGALLAAGHTQSLAHCMALLTVGAVRFDKAFGHRVLTGVVREHTPVESPATMVPDGHPNPKALADGLGVLDEGLVVVDTEVDIGVDTGAEIGLEVPDTFQVGFA